MSDPKPYPEDSGPFHPDEVDGVDEGISELDEPRHSDLEESDDAPDGDATAGEGSADAGRAR